MEQWIILLRGVNVGGGGKLPMADLRKVLTDAGFLDVKTYIQSGNVIFQSDLAKADVEGQVANLIAKNFGFEPAVMALRATQLAAAIDQSPFQVDDKKTLHLIFQKGQVHLDEAGLQSVCTQQEEFRLQDGVFYLFTPNGYGRSAAAGKLQKYLSSDAMTARNLNSCEKLLKLAQSE